MRKRETPAMQQLTYRMMDNTDESCWQQYWYFHSSFLEDAWAKYRGYNAHAVYFRNLCCLTASVMSSSSIGPDNTDKTNACDFVWLAVLLYGCFSDMMTFWHLLTKFSHSVLQDFHLMQNERHNCHFCNKPVTQHIFKVILLC